MNPVYAEIITIGDELLYGQIIDTNSQWISIELGKLGFQIRRKFSVGDEESEIGLAIAEAFSRSHLLILTGGLGPTNDDITKKVLCNYFKCGYETNQQVLSHVTDLFLKRGRPLLEVNKQQAQVPTASRVLFNRLGTAPGMWFEKEGKILIALPGVPHEMKTILTEVALPQLKVFFTLPAIYHKTVRTVGIGESFLAEKILVWEETLPANVKLAYLPSPGQVKLRITSMGEKIGDLEIVTDKLIHDLNTVIGEHVYGFDADELEAVVGKILKRHDLTISTAESCTGGSVAATLTSVPGSAAYFKGSIIAYCNEIKKAELGVNSSTLEQYGAVSEQTVLEMADGVRKKLGTSIGVAASGIAGPDGGSDEKPVGTVWIAYSDHKETVANKLMLTTDRALNIQLTVVHILNLVRRKVRSYAS